MLRLVGILVVGLLLAPLAAAPVPKEKPKPKDGPNSNELLKKHKGNATFTASSAWNGWAVEKAFDGDPQTSWFSATGDCKTAKKLPSIDVVFPEDVRVSRVTVLGNREPSWPTGYFCWAGRLELLDKDGKVLVQINREATGEKKDLEFALAEPFGRVRTVRFLSTDDDSTHGGNDCIAIGEVQIE